ncbi:CDP-glycerol glycerophosphotransferase family protein [Salinibacterium sp. SWN1162]|uniref:CDP-glycerol glycerophosphotransferase family protein n=1 Tax=Salinibacterium sp. SWN1162 TaxID=2792053 RepID=UPI0018CD81D9|nr:CDP-glycerol glycerophosphotransferase family protein [Salinibacterium sp. SWN1162]MBH0008737.1 CDP-glycerol glycerophosphotransferase family protein [Salinibacterium sp. SWN1162]
MKLFSRSSANDRGSFAKRFEQANGLELVANALASFSVVSLLLGIELWLALAAAGIAFAVIVAFGLPALRKGKGWRQYVGRFVLSRVLILIAIGYAYVRTSDELLVWVSVGILSFLIGTEVNCAKVAAGAIPYGVNLPGVSVRNYPLFRVNFIFLVNVIAMFILAALAWFGVNPWIGIAVTLVAAVPTSISLLDGILRVRSRRIAERQLPSALAAVAPTFAVHWDAPAKTDYQLAMWLPYLERLNKPFIVVVRNRASFIAASKLTTAPVLLRSVVADMDGVIASTLKAVFYVNSNARNVHMARYTHLTHIQLLHGESDKAPSFNPVLRMFDKNFVAGQAAIDRFARAGIETAPGWFSIVGRPQVENIAVAGETTDRSGHKTVMYAPTWAGYFADSNYSSLPIGVAVVQALLQRGARVVFRSHPYTAVNASHAAEAERIVELLAADRAASGREHLWGPAAEKDLSTTECFNISDALISDVSSIVPDFLYSEKPFAIAAIAASEDFVEEFPLAKASYLLARDGSNIEQVLDELLVNDSLLEERRNWKKYYLGDFAPEGYVDVFLNEAGKYV